MRRINIKELFQNRKTLYLTLGIILISVLSLTVVYAALSVTLNITGNSEITASNWDIHLANPTVKNGSIHNNLPTINNNNLSFNATLSKPGDYYEFTVDVVNDGSIDAMIDSVVKMPELTTEQAKYIKYEVSYENGESISTKQTLKKGTRTPIKVRIEYRTDLSTSDLPNTETNLTLKLTLIYVQSDGSGSEIPNNGETIKIVNVISGDGTQVGDEICISEECFYVISSDTDSVTMLAKYNLYVGGKYENNTFTAYSSEATGKQDATMLGYNPNNKSGNGVVVFSEIPYWWDWDNDVLREEYGTNYPAYVYDSDSNIYLYIENYRDYLETLDVEITEARLINFDELLNIGCYWDDAYGYCDAGDSWVYSTSYWVGTSMGDGTILNISSSDGVLLSLECNYENHFGVRPVITISKSYIE